MELKSEPQQSQKNCFTCLRQSEEGMQISSETCHSDSVTIVELLTKHFWFQQDDFIEQQHVICWTCWNRLDEFHQFYQEVEQKHRTLKQEPSKVIVCKIEPKLTEDEDSNHVDEIQHDEVEMKEENWVESEEKGSDEEYKPEFSSNEENSEEGESEPEESPLAKRVPRPRKEKQESWIGEPVDPRQANNPVRLVKKWADDDAFIKNHVQYTCSVCKDYYRTFSQLKRHMMSMHNMQGCVTCCGKRYYTKLSLLEHVQKLQDPDRFKCDICHKILIDSCAVRRHKREIHVTDEQKRYHCDRCPRRFVRLALLEYHLKGHDNLENGTVKCPHCEKPFPTTARLNTHIKTRHAPRSDKVQRELSSEKLRVQCDICHQWLKNKAGWRKHYQRHTQGPSACDICGYVSPNPAALVGHKWHNHRTEASFVCPDCGKLFKRAISLREHMASHTGKALYACTFCDKTFNFNANMFTHRKKMHPKEWLEHKNAQMAAQQGVAAGIVQ